MITSLFLFILLIILLLFFKSKPTIDFLQPSIIFTIIILITYLLTTLRLSGLQNVYPYWFTILILFLTFCFYLGERSSSLLTIPQLANKVNYNPNTMRILTFLMWFVIMFSFIKMTTILGAPPAISKSNRAEYFVSGWGTIVVTQLSFWGLVLYDRFNKNSNGWMFWFYFITMSIIAFLLSNKFQIIYMILLYLIAFNSFRKKIKFKNIILVSIMGVLVFGLLFKFVYRDMYGVSLATMFYSYKMNLPYQLAFLIQPYLYISFNFDNLYEFLNSQTQQYYGLKTFGSFIDILGLSDYFSNQSQNMISEWKDILRIKSMTTGTMFQDFAQDANIVGMIIMTYFLGVYSGITYKMYRFNKDFISFFLYSATIVAIFMSFFSNVFTSKVTILNIIAAYLLNTGLKVNFMFGRKYNG